MRMNVSKLLRPGLSLIIAGLLVFILLSGLTANGQASDVEEGLKAIPTRVLAAVSATDSWLQKSPATKPSSRSQHKMTKISSGKVLLFGGTTGGAETWIFDSTAGTWTQKSPASSPSSRAQSGLAYSGTDGQAVLFGGSSGGAETWTYTLGSNTWSQQSPANSPAARSQHGMDYIGDDQIVVFGGWDGGGNLVDTWVYDVSANTWTNKSPGTSPPARRDMGLAYIGDDKILMFGGYTSTRVNDTWVYDLSANTWTQLTPAASPSARSRPSLETIGSDQVILFGGGFSGGGRSDETWLFDLSVGNWTQKSPATKPAARYATDLAALATDQVVLFGGNDTADLDDTWVIEISSSGMTWTPQTSGTANGLNDIAYGGQFVIAGNGGTILTSPDGTNWTARTSGTTIGLGGAAYGGNQFIVLGDNTILTSPDGVAWTAQNPGTAGTFYDGVYGGGQFVIVGASTIRTSSDGVTWTVRLTIAETFQAVTYAGSQFVVVGRNGVIRTSPDGITWTPRTSGTTDFLGSVTYGDSQFIAVGENGTILTSPDGITWTAQTSGTTEFLADITYGGSQFVAVGDNGTILTSPNGVTWTAENSGTTEYLAGVANNNSQFVAVGMAGTILTSGNSAASVTVNAVAPNPNTHTATPAANLSFTATAALKPSTVVADKFAVYGSGHGLMAGSISLSNSDTVATHNPTKNFFPGEIIHASASSNIQDSGGSAIAPYVWQFRTAVSTGSGTFTNSGQSLGGGRSRQLALGDLDSDGDLDAFIANSDSQPNKVWLNTNGTFAKTAQTLGSSTSSDVALGDLDGDGDLDAFIANFNSEVDRVWFNNGSGSFTDSGQSLGAASSSAVALGDLDGDGDLDALVTTNNANRIWINDGSGTFSSNGQSLGSVYSLSVALGDLDEDGDLDAFVSNATPNSDQVWLNDGTGIFTSSVQSLGTKNAQTVQLGDFDQDGDLDAFVVNRSPDSNTVWLNDGSGNFSDSGQTLGAGVDHLGASLGDVDADGDLDAFVANFGGSNTLYTNNGSGVFSASAQSLGSSDSHAAQFGDLDGDGDLDAFVANFNGQSNKVWLNADKEELPTVTSGTLLVHLNGDQGVISSGGQVTHWLDQSPNGFIFTATGNPQPIADVYGLQDGIRFDGDDRLTSVQDIQFFTTTNSGLTAFVIFETDNNSGQKFLINHGFSPKCLTSFELGYDTGTSAGVGNFGLHTGCGYATVNTADPIANDTYYLMSTVVLPTGNTPSNLIFYKDGYGISRGDHGTGWTNAGAYETRSTTLDIGARNDFGSGTFDAYHVGDIVEIVIYQGALTNIDRQKIEAYLMSPQVTAVDPATNSHTAALTASPTITMSQALSTTTATTATIRGHGGFQGRLDGNLTFSGGDQIITYDPTVNFKPGEIIQTTLTSGVRSQDGRLANPYVWNFRASVSGGYGHADAGWAETTPGINTTAVALGDLDGDGDLDIFETGRPLSYNSATSPPLPSRVWLNNGNGSYTEKVQAPVLNQRNAFEAALGDLDGDGDLDAFVASAEDTLNAQDCKVWFNDGSANFTDSGQNLGFEDSVRVALGDLDGDGDLDAFIVNNVGAPDEVWLNNGAGTFTKTAQSFGSLSGWDVGLGDLDNDGDLDAVVGNHSSGADQIWLNDGRANFSAGQALSTADSWDVDLGDIDNDGDLDIVTYNEIYKNDGAANFTSTSQNLAGSPVLGDFDGDGDLDIHVNRWFGASTDNEIWLNDGSGAFTQTSHTLDTGDTYSVDLGDVDGDGDLDVISGNENNEALTVWLNRPPVTAEADSYQTIEDYQLMVSAPGVLTNDTGTGLTAVLASAVNTGTLDLQSTGAFTYTPPADYSGLVTYTYSATVPGASQTALVTITVTAANDPPVAGADTYSTPEDTPLTVAALGVLANDSDVEGATLAPQLGVAPMTGTLDLISTGAFTYTPAADHYGTVTFTYIITDGPLTETGLLAHLKLDEGTGTTASDSSGNSNMGILTTGASWTGNTPAVQFSNPTALRLDGTNQYVAFPPNFPTVTDFSFAAWVYWDGSAFDWHRIFDFGQNTNVNMFLTPKSDAGTLRFAITLGSNPAEERLNAPAAFPTNQWVHVAVTLDGDTGKLYQNGVLQDTQTITLNPSDVVGPFAWLGRSIYGDPYFDGDMDEIQVYGRALTASEIATLASGQPSTAGLSDTGTVTISVTSVNDAPTTVNDNVTLGGNGGPQTIAVLSNDTFAPDHGETLQITNITQGTSGTVVITTGGADLTYDPNNGFLGNDSFNYTLSDGNGGTDTATVAITVTPMADLQVPWSFASPTAVCRGEQFSTLFELSNTGSADSGNLDVFVYNEATAGVYEFLVGEIGVTGPALGQSAYYGFSTNSFFTGTRYINYWVDGNNAFTEGNEINNGGHISVTVQNDPAPQGSVVINGDVAFTNSEYITLTLSATDTGNCATSVDEMRFVYDGILTQWEPYAPNKYLQIQNAAAENFAIYAQFRDEHDNAGPFVGDAIQIDQISPHSSITAPNGRIMATSFTVSWWGQDNLSNIAGYDVQYNLAGGNWLDWVTDTLATTANFVGAQAGETYCFRTRAVDAVGNQEDYPTDVVGDACVEVLAPETGVDLVPLRLEFNQGIQTPGNSVPLIANKPMVIRVPLGTGTSVSNITNVNAQLYARRGGQAVTNSPLEPESGSLTVTPNGNHALGENTLEFIVPHDWVTGDLEVYVEIDHGRQIAEASENNNRFPATGYQTVSFNQPPDLELTLVPIRWQQGTQTLSLNNDEIMTAVAEIQQIYPAAQVVVSIHPTFNYSGTTLQWETLLGQIDTLREVENPTPEPYQKYLGLIPAPVDLNLGDRVGLAYMPGATAIGYIVPGDDLILPQTLAHTFGRSGVAATPACTTHDNPDAVYPYANGMIQYAGWDYVHETLIPGTQYDLLTDCPLSWISDYTYRALYDGLEPGAVVSVQDLNPTVFYPQPARDVPAVQGDTQAATLAEITALEGNMLVSGQVQPDGSAGQIIAAFTFSETASIRLLDDGPFTVALVDRNGHEHQIRAWGLNTLSAQPDPTAQHPFALLFPRHPALSAIRLYHAGTLLHEITTGTQPAVTLTATIPATLSGAIYTLTWDGPAGQTYLVRYSDDNGQTWQVLSAPQMSTSLEIDLTTLPGTTTGMFEVVASNGVRSTFVRSTHFTVADSPPKVIIFSPFGGSPLPETTLVTLSGSATDLEDGALNGAQLTWISDLDGVLGTGNQLTVELLSGNHVITLQVTDSQGQTSAAQVSLKTWQVFLPLVLK
jgi:hypothetical protein